MLKKILSTIILIGVCLTLCACKKQKAIILFNRYPITKETLLFNATEFVEGKKFYYIFMSQKPIKNDIIRVRVRKKDGKWAQETVKPVYSNDFRLNKDEVYYYTDYLVIHEAGEYSMWVYDRYNMTRPLAISDFRIKK